LHTNTHTRFKLEVNKYFHLPWKLWLQMDWVLFGLEIHPYFCRSALWPFSPLVLPVFE